MLDFTFENGDIIRLWVLDVGQWCKLSEARDMLFEATKTGSLIYETESYGYHRAIEHNLWQDTIWQWVSKYMSRGFNAGDNKLKSVSPPANLDHVNAQVTPEEQSE